MYKYASVTCACPHMCWCVQICCCCFFFKKKPFLKTKFIYNSENSLYVYLCMQAFGYLHRYIYIYKFKFAYMPMWIRVYLAHLFIGNYMYIWTCIYYVSYYIIITSVTDIIIIIIVVNTSTLKMMMNHDESSAYS